MEDNKESLDTLPDTLCIFLGKDKYQFRQLKSNIKELWFMKHGENLTMSKLLIMAMSVFKESIKN